MGLQTTESENSRISYQFFRTFHLSLLGAELGPKLRQKWADHSISTVGQLKMKRTVQSQIKFLEKLQERLNRIIVTYQNANSHLGKFNEDKVLNFMFF